MHFVNNAIYLLSAFCCFAFTLVVHNTLNQVMVFIKHLEEKMTIIIILERFSMTV